MSVKLSILIPAYNPGIRLRILMDQLKPQMETHPDAEIIVVDDGSSEDIRWVAEYPQTIYYHKPNGGEPTARNALMLLADGKFIQFLDADDEVYGDALDIIYSNIEQGYDYVSYEFDTDHDRKRSYHNYGQVMVNCAMWGYTFRKAIFGNELFNPDLKVGCDTDILQRILHEGLLHKHDSRAFYNYRWDNNDKSLCHRHLRGEI